MSVRKRNHRWIVELSAYGKAVFVGSFTSQEEAEKAQKAAEDERKAGLAITTHPRYVGPRWKPIPPKIGKLTIIDQAGEKLYFGVLAPLWKCRCECGNIVKREQKKLLPRPSVITAMKRDGIPSWAQCDDCRAKICAVCGDRFPFEQTGIVCKKEFCRQERDREINQFWYWTYKADPEMRKKNRERARRYRATVPREQLREYEQRYYEKIRSDPKKWADELAKQREWRTKRAREEFMADAQTLLEKIDNE